MKEISIFMNPHGIIIASGGSKRISDLHGGVLEILRNGEPMIVAVDNMPYGKDVLAELNELVSSTVAKETKDDDDSNDASSGGKGKV